MKFIKAGATSQSTTFLLVDDDGNVVTGKAAATLPDIYYQRTNEARAQITLSDAASIGAVYGSGKVFEVGGGRYRLDLPDAAVATATSLDLMGDTTGMHVIHEQIQVGLDLSGTTVRGDVLQATTIATLASQTSFTLTDGSADDNAYNDCPVVIEDGTTAAQKAVGFIKDYTGSTKTVTLLVDPAIFTMAVGDKVTIMATDVVARYVAAVCAGLISGAGTGTEVIKSLDGTTTRLTATVDASGNRTAITYG